MTYTKYHTEAIVLQHFDVGEADRVYALFTRELGFLYAKAQSVRALKSKIRYGLQLYSTAEVSLIRTKDRWKIATARPLKSWHGLFISSESTAVLLRNVFGVLKRLVTGEEKNVLLYEIVSESLSFLERHDLSLEEIHGLEALLMLRILHTLGYLSDGGPFSYLLAGSHVSDLYIYEAGRLRSRAVPHINRTLGGL